MKYEPGHRVGEWTLLAVEPGQQKRGAPRKERMWKCQCTCGAIRMVRVCNLYSGQSKGCGHDNPRVARHAQRNLRPINSVFALGGGQ